MREQGGGLLIDHPVAHCDGVEAAEASLAEVFLPVELAVDEPRRLRMMLNAMQVGRATLGYMAFDRAFEMVTAEAQAYYVDIPISGAATMRAGGSTASHRVSRERGMIYGPGRPALLDCSPGYAQLSIKIPEADLRRAAEDLLGRPVTSTIELDERLDLTGSSGRLLLESLDLIERASHHDDGPLSHPLASQHVERVLIDSLLFAQSHSLTRELTASPTPAGSSAVSRAVEMLHARPERPWTVAELAREVSTSTWSLHQGFRDQLQTTPMVYLKRLRLERARADLLAADPAVSTVSGVAYRWGFVNVGRFAAEYRARFGEQPSHTLRR